MKHRLLLAAALLSPALLAAPRPETKIAFSMSAGSSSVKKYSSVVELTLDSMDGKVNGEPLPFTPDIDMSVTTKTEIHVSDEYVSMRSGAPKKLERTFEKLGSHSDMRFEMDMMGTTNSQSMSIDSSSELEGRTVIFTWSDSADDYVATFRDDAGDKELLEGLYEDMDLRSFLPAGAVSKGDSWDVPPASLALILAPGGNVKLVPEDTDAGEMMGMNSNMGAMSDWFTDSIRGDLSAKLASILTAGDGKRTAMIEIAFRISNAVDLTEIVESAMENMEIPGAGDVDFDHLDLELKLSGDGRLVWDLDAGHAVSFELTGDFAMLMNMGMAIKSGGMDLDIEQTMEFSGTLSHSATFE